MSQQAADGSGPAGRELLVPRYSLQGIGTAICWVSGIALLPLGIAIVAEFQQAALMTDLIAGLGVSDKWRSAENVEVAASLSAWLLGLPAFVLLVIWSWRASKNVQKWGEQSGRGVRRGAGWAIGGWFIPIGNFWIPYQTIQDAWQRAPWTDGSWQRYDDPQRNNAWLISWLTWVTASLLDRLVIRNWLSDETPREFRTTYFLDAFTNVLLAVSVISLIIAVKQISDRHALH